MVFTNCQVFLHFFTKILNLGDLGGVGGEPLFTLVFALRKEKIHHERHKPYELFVRGLLLKPKEAQIVVRDFLGLKVRYLSSGS